MSPIRARVTGGVASKENRTDGKDRSRQFGPPLTMSHGLQGEGLREEENLAMLICSCNGTHRRDVVCGGTTSFRCIAPASRSTRWPSPRYQIDFYALIRAHASSLTREQAVGQARRVGEPARTERASRAPLRPAARAFTDSRKISTSWWSQWSRLRTGSTHLA